MKKTQYAVRITAKDRLEITEAMPIPVVGPTHILVKVEACGICFSDTKLMHAFQAHPRKTPILAGLSEDELAQIPTYRPGLDPVVPGHEPVGRVVALGDLVTRFRVGQRVCVQTDYRHLPTAASNASLGYGIDGALQEYALVDERMVIDPETGASYLIEISEEPSSAAIALVEPWACVENSYSGLNRASILPGGSLLVVRQPGCEPIDIDEFIATSGSVRFLDSLDGLEDSSHFDDIIYAGADARSVEALGPHLAKGGMMNVVTCGRVFSSPVGVDAGRIHYDAIRYVGTTSNAVKDGYASIPPTTELRAGEKVGVIGAGGPMGLMHTVRAATVGVDVASVDAIDIDAERLGRLHQVMESLAGTLQVTVINSATTALRPTYTYVALMVPSPALLAEAVDLVGEFGIVNAFAGFGVGTLAALDFNAILARHILVVGSSGSRIEDMQVVLDRIDAARVDTTVSLDAICGMAGVAQAIESVDNRTSQGKIVVFPHLHNLGLHRLVDLPQIYPEVAQAMTDGRWTKEAEQVLVEIA